MDTPTQTPIRTVIKFGALHNEATSYRPGDAPVTLDLTQARDKGKLSAVAAALCDVHGLGSVRDRNEVAKRSIERSKVREKQRRPERKWGKGYVEEAREAIAEVNAVAEAAVTKTKLHLPMGA